MATISITQKQTPTFRAMVKDEFGRLFDLNTDLATTDELTAEGIDAAPIAVTIYRSTESLTPYESDIENAEIVAGFDSLAIDSSAFLESETVQADGLNYNFQWTPESRAVFPFDKVGYYFADFIVYPKTGAAIVFRVGVIVK